MVPRRRYRVVKILLGCWYAWFFWKFVLLNIILKNLIFSNFNKIFLTKRWSKFTLVLEKWLFLSITYFSVYKELPSKFICNIIYCLAQTVDDSLTFKATRWWKQLINKVNILFRKIFKVKRAGYFWKKNSSFKGEDFLIAIFIQFSSNPSSIFTPYEYKILNIFIASLVRLMHFILQCFFF